MIPKQALQQQNLPPQNTLTTAGTVAIARIHDEWFAQIPEDLYIPPAAFQILLDYFEGPLDFLLYLVHKNGLNLVTLDIAPIASQYLHYIQNMQALNIELAADYLVMAASLADIKSRLLLPRPQLSKPEDDPRQELLDRLQHYARIKQGASHLQQCTVLERDTFAAAVSTQAAMNCMPVAQTPQFNAQALLTAMQLILNRPRLQEHQVVFEEICLEDRIDHILATIRADQSIRFDQLLHTSQGRMGIVVTFMAVLELIRQQKIKVVSAGLQEPLVLQGELLHAA